MNENTLKTIAEKIQKALKNKDYSLVDHLKRGLTLDDKEIISRIIREENEEIRKANCR